MGDGFIARDITFVNSAGPSAEQAVALRVGADKSVVYRCSIEGYQDSLYTHSKRQFYRDTDITGTVDFVFGNSAVVFQSCNFVARKSGQKNFVTAQGRSNPGQNTGISIHNCKITAQSTTYLGRPWKEYSRTVVMQSFLGGSIPPSGWSPWSGGFGLKTLFYGEFGNSGPASSVSGRVKWAGYHSSLTVKEAEGFTVAGFIGGTMWLPSTGVSFDSGLVKHLSRVRLVSPSPLPRILWQHNLNSVSSDSVKYYPLEAVSSMTLCAVLFRQLLRTSLQRRKTLASSEIVFSCSQNLVFGSFNVDLDFSAFLRMQTLGL
ncbi:hypothetical protein Rs2_18098 [Raphanus sativus]|nr:hypothetical protein Rs2_18098 [Raphanus sativus]